MPADVVQRVNRLSRRPLGLTALEFADRAGVPIADEDDDHEDNDDDDDDNDFDPDDDDDDDNDDDDDDAIIAGVDNDEHEHDENENIDMDATNDDNLAIMDNVNNLELELELEMDADGAFDAGPADDVANANAPTVPIIEVDTVNEDEDEAIDGDEANDDDDNDNDEVEIDVGAQMDAQYGPRTGKYDLRARKPRDYGHLHITLESIAMTQHSVRKGLKIFGEAGVIAVTKELVQLHERGVVEPKFIQDLDGDQKQAALQYLMFLKQKRNGIIKGRGCADGRKQRAHTSKEAASSPTVAIESVMLSCVD